jgi:DNA-binding transcriptional regulator YhcF (GntR family)
MAKQASSVFCVDVTGLEGALDQPTYVRICERIRAAITGGAPAPKTRLPSSRVLAKDLGVARNNVDEALRQLVADDHVIRRRATGTFVVERLPERDAAPLLSAPMVATKRTVAQWQPSRRAGALKSYPGHYRPLLDGKVLADESDKAWVETPGYQPAVHCLRAAGPRVAPVPVDEKGLNVSKGKRVALEGRPTASLQEWTEVDVSSTWEISTRSSSPRCRMAGLADRAAGNHDVTCPRQCAHADFQ